MKSAVSEAVIAIPEILARVDEERLREIVFGLAGALPCRTVNHTRPGQTRSTLDEADDYVESLLDSWGYRVERECVPVQASRCDLSMPKAHQHSPALAGDPWYAIGSLYAHRTGSVRPDEVILLTAHKDSQSWMYPSPGAYDNAAGTAGVLEIARLLSDQRTDRSIRFLFCNEEHQPWSSVHAAKRTRERGDNLVAIFNLDGIGGKPQSDIDARRKTNVSVYTTCEGKRLADLMQWVNKRYRIGLLQSSAQRDRPGDDDGSFINAGYPHAIMNTGSHPYDDPNYHRETDVPELVDIANVRMAVQAALASVLTIDAGRFSGMGD